MSTRVVVASDGTDLSVRVSGQPDGPTLLLCDGIGCDGYVWKYIRRAFESRCRIIHFHYRGHGLSAVPTDFDSLTIERCATDAWEVLDACGVDDVILWGHSMGVQVILEAAHMHPDRVRAVLPMCGAFERPLDTLGGGAGVRLLPVISSAIFARPDTLRRLWAKWVPTELAYKIAVATEINARMIQRDDFAPYLDHLGRMEPVVVLPMLDNQAHHTPPPLQPSNRAPAPVIAGARDSMTPSQLSEELTHLLPDAELLVVPAGSHTAPIELPDLVTLRAERFFRARGIL